MADPRSDPAGDGTGAPPPRPKLPRRQPAETRRESEFPYCAATQGSEAEAAALEADEARRFAGRVGQTRRRLTTGLLAEAERAGTAAAEPPTQSAEAFARQAHGQGARAIRAAARWQERRAAFAEGRLADGADPTRPAAWIPGPSPGSSAGTARDHGGGGGTGRGQIPHWPGPREHASSSPASSNRHPGLEPGPRPKVGPAPERRAPPPADGPASVPGQTRDDERSGDAALASLQAAPPHLPDWLDQVPGVNRAQLLAMKPEERAVTLRTIARFYGFDTS
jgi:hypothetical protein